MNKERLLQLADFLETPEVAEHFNMEYSFYIGRSDVDTEDNAREALHKCGTAACIGGWAIALFQPNTKVSDVLAYMAAPLLGINDEDAHALFYSFTNSRITPIQAAGVIRNFVATGYVDWIPVRSALNMETFDD